jgi:DNA-directed RNA polymerase specialized sigma24 family protein/GR25 family glycosyltransferase involved in LPS biosynthesis
MLPNDANEKTWAAMPEAEKGAAFGAYMAHSAALREAGVMRAGDPPLPSATAHTVRFRDGALPGCCVGRDGAAARDGDARVNAAAAAERVAREGSGRLLAFLLARGHGFAAAEDALADAFAAAPAAWPVAGVPRKPEASLLTAVRRRLMDAHRCAKTASAAAPELRREAAAEEDAEALPDHRLALLLARAAEKVEPASRAALMLQCVLGLDAARIASAFLASPAAMGQRLVRAKRRIAAADARFALPGRAEVAARLPAVLEAICAAYTALAARAGGGSGSGGRAAARRGARHGPGGARPPAARLRPGACIDRARRGVWRRVVTGSRLILASEQIQYLKARNVLAGHADAVFAALGGRVPLGSVCEVGCGEGGFLAAALRAGAGQVLGVEHVAPPLAQLRIPAEQIRLVDDLNAAGLGAARRDAAARHDLVICLHIAQRLPADALPAFLDALADLGDAVLFAAPVPGQGGNPTTPGLFLQEVQRAFGKRGFWMDDFFRPATFSDRAVPLWARQGLVLFRRGAAPAAAGPGVPATAVHEHSYGALLREASALAAEVVRLRRTMTLPIRRLMALDAALLAEDAALAERIFKLLEPELRRIGAPLPVAELCEANDLMAAALHIFTPALAAETADRRHLRYGAVLAEAAGRPDLAWELLDRAGATAEATVPLVQHALRLGKRDWLDAVLAAPEAPAAVARFAAFRDLPSVPAPPVYVVNLPSDQWRRRRAARNLADLGLDARFRRGFRPLEIPEEGRALFRGVCFDAATDGSFGNQYSQYLVWREIAEGDAPVALTLEDDSLLLANPGAVLAATDLPDGWDVIFANPRLDLTESVLPPAGRFVVTPLAEAFLRHSDTDPGKEGYGSDCVFISRAGARKLLEIVAAEGFHSVGTDWYVQSHCLSDEQIAAFNPASVIWREMTGRVRLRPAGLPLLEGYVLGPAISQIFTRGMSRAQRI